MASKFPDVKRQYQIEAVNYLVDRGFIKGKDDGTFGVDEPITRGDMAAILYRILTSTEAPPLPDPEVPDKPDPSPIETPLTWSQVQTIASEVSVKIDMNGVIGSGTLLPGGYILTARHVAWGNPFSFLTKNNGKWKAEWVADHPKVDDEKGGMVDLSLYRIKDPDLYGKLPYAVRDKNGRVNGNQELLSVVHGDAFGKVKRGKVDRPSITTSIPPIPWMFDCSIDANKGDSGGGVFNQFGELVGVIKRETSVNELFGSTWSRVPGCEVIQLSDPIVKEWLDQFVK
ncbi:trypsin-like peptidase domain-containing protein [Brevibacillus migulae]|uniref:trypsin-like peptidase domain-containing protein n=1 Tax=Brevibacillus migulae TaxID=1644114 RepID=UPI00106E62AA|nr:trypsin-like peptidase domain-containing protein [Brevibacillus migulae]